MSSLQVFPPTGPFQLTSLGLVNHILGKSISNETPYFGVPAEKINNFINTLF
jgi:hypothetical protein